MRRGAPDRLVRRLFGCVALASLLGACGLAGNQVAFLDRARAYEILADPLFAEDPSGASDREERVDYQTNGYWTPGNTMILYVTWSYSGSDEAMAVGLVERALAAGWVGIEVECQPSGARYRIEMARDFGDYVVAAQGVVAASHDAPDRLLRISARAKKPSTGPDAPGLAEGMAPISDRGCLDG